jgi:hypothetical protein
MLWLIWFDSTCSLSVTALLETLPILEVRIAHEM